MKINIDLPQSFVVYSFQYKNEHKQVLTKTSTHVLLLLRSANFRKIKIHVTSSKMLRFSSKKKHFTSFIFGYLLSEIVLVITKKEEENYPDSAGYPVRVTACYPAITRTRYPAKSLPGTSLLSTCQSESESLSAW